MSFLFKQMEKMRYYREKRRADQAEVELHSQPKTSHTEELEKVNQVLRSRIRILEMEVDDHVQQLKDLLRKLQHSADHVLQLQDQVEELEAVKGLCGICEEQPIDSVFLPCNHAYACKPCATGCKTCPVCRGQLGIGTLYLKK